MDYRSLFMSLSLCVCVCVTQWFMVRFHCSQGWKLDPPQKTRDSTCYPSYLLGLEERARVHKKKEPE